MSEPIQKNEIRSIRCKLLTGASAVALVAYLAAAPIAEAEDGDRPTVWIELGGQLSQLQNGQELYSPPFVALTPSNLLSPQASEKPARFGSDENASLMFQPNGSDWTFSASIRYGRADNSKHVRQQSNPGSATGYVKFHRSSYGVYNHHTNYYQVKPNNARFTDATVKNGESHAIVDFQAGRDLGIGMFGRAASSSLNVGVRFAQFTSKSVASLKENPDWQFKTHATTFSTAYERYGYNYSVYRKNLRVLQPYHSFAGTFRANRSFSGLGPSISWKSSAPFVGNSQAGELTFDWGVNAALLFGRQKVKTNHQTTAHYYAGYYLAPHVPVYNHDHPSRISSRMVMVPNVGAFAGLSFQYPNAKVSLGYRGDFFFGAMDGGIDVRKSEDRSFFGPFASVSVGIGG